MKRSAFVLLTALAACADTNDLDGGGGSTPATASGGDAAVTSTGDTTSAKTAAAADASSGQGTGGSAPNDCPRARVQTEGGEVLNVRPSASTAEAPIGTLHNNQIVDVVDRVSGETIDGNDVWFSIHTDELDGFVFSGFAVCTMEMPPDLMPPAAFYAPFECGRTANVTQGNNGATSHYGRTRYAFDFGLPLETPLLAMADGIVLFTFDETGPGDNCYNGGGPECAAFSNYVSLLHGDGTTTIYKHLNAVTVTIGEFVPRMGQVGLSGSTGYSTGPHAHVMRQEECGEANCQSVPLAFAEVGGSGVPETGDAVTSENCP